MTATFTHLVLAVAVLLGTALAQPTFEMRTEPRPVPGTAALEAARTEELADLVDGILGQGNDLRGTQQALFEAAARAGDDATRYVLMWQAVEVAERAGSPATAMNGLFHLEAEFDIDREELTRDLLRRMGGHGAAPEVAAAVAVIALIQAEQAFHREDDTPMLRLFDTAMHAAVGSCDAWLHAFVRDELPRLRSAHRTWRELCASVDDPEVRRVRDERLQQMVLWPEFLGPAVLGDIEPLLHELPEDLRDVRACDAGPERLLELAPHARHDWARRGLERYAKQLVSERWRHARTDAERVAIGRDLRTLTERIADRQGINRLRFRSAGDLDQLVLTNAVDGQWRIEDGLLIGKASGNQDFATHRFAFGSIRSVVIRGGIRSAAGLNFRCKVGDVNLLWNWEVKPENHLWINGRRQEKGPPALRPGTEHAIALHATDAGVLVFVDDVHWWTAPGSLTGTLTVYPALGSEIFVREILVDGQLAWEAPVPGPRGELK